MTVYLDKKKKGLLDLLSKDLVFVKIKNADGRKLSGNLQNRYGKEVQLMNSILKA